MGQQVGIKVHSRRQLNAGNPKKRKPNPETDCLFSFDGLITFPAMEDKSHALTGIDGCKEQCPLVTFLTW